MSMLDKHYKVIATGAEAILVKQGNKLIKYRIKKNYRWSELDYRLRLYRTRIEARIMQKVSNLIPVPRIIKVEKPEKIVMEYIKGKKLNEWLDRLNDKTKQVCFYIGKNIATLHKNDIIHNDLTTSNMILRQDMVYFIDFGLAFHSHRVEDKAVDIHLLKQALDSKHYINSKKYFKWVIKAYTKNYNEAGTVLKQLEKVEKRGRYKRKNKKCINH